MSATAIKMNTLVLGDCLEIMRQMPDKAFSLAVCDPPYGIGAENGTGKYSRLNKAVIKGKKWDIRPETEYFEELFRVSKNQCIFGGNYFNLPIMRGWVCWYKTSEIAGRDFSEFELIWTSFDRPARLISEKPFIRDGQRQHPCQKPIALYDWILANYAKQGDTILDTHAGSGSLCIAAHNAGLDWLGIEIDEDYHRMAAERIERHTSQLSMFRKEG